MVWQVQVQLVVVLLVEIHPVAHVNIIEFITIATTGNATDFGDLTIYQYEL